MYIKSVRMQGFKSFADKLELDFNTGISAIVGPNGSGKSNIVDAILWVLGEQSVKSLRGDSAMSDVIFSGSKSREPLKKASVAITFDNTDHMLLTPLNEVEIKRIIYTSGENEYYINNARVRLKDITDLLIDVTSKFNIITQGNINDLVENKSSERRILFESAAGVLKYKKRKEESLKKLEGTNENLTRVNLIIKELLTTLTPLEKQKQDAENYLKIKDQLENTEIALVTNDLTNLTSKFDKLKMENDELKKQLDNHDKDLSSKAEKLKLEIMKIDEDEKTTYDNINKIKNEITSLNGQKQIMIERAKFNLDGQTIDSNLLKIKEEKKDYEIRINTIKQEVDLAKKELQKDITRLNELSDEEIKTKIKIGNLNNDLNKVKNDILFLQNRIKIETSNIENNAFLPKSVSSIIGNPLLKGIHNTIGNVITVSDAHAVAIETALGASTNFIIVDDMHSAKEAINYLKENHLGRSTFFPIDTIVSRKISKDVEYTLASLTGFIGIASDLISYDQIYNEIIENQLGNVVVVENIDALFDIAKILEYKYKMVSLQGDIIYPGGSISGGTSKSSNNNILNKLKSELNNKEVKQSTLELNLKNEDSKYTIITNNSDVLRKKVSNGRVEIESKELNLKKLNEEYTALLNSIQDLDDLKNNKINNSLDNLINTITEKEKSRELEEVNLKNLQSKRFDLENELSEEEKYIQKKNNEYRKLENTIQNNEVEIGKYEVKIDNLFSTLSNDYNITYEYALNNYSLDINMDVARNLVNNLKSQMKSLNNVNLGSIDEYNRLKKRYDFLDKQKSDLESASEELKNIIAEMDTIMIDKFKTTYQKIAAEFSKIFRIMFRGGNGLLKLTDENDLLNTGINIMAVPPGKKLNSTASLSGGEKALTAICLIFAILNVKPAPFIILDEVEAALDEENVNMFGEYLSNNKKDCQFILITHKKKMMEFADILYGVTMQESGVSKLVSVKLEDI